MKDYLMIFRGGLNYTSASAKTQEEATASWKTWMEELAKDGRLAGGNRLVRDGAVLSGTKKTLHDGPFVEGKEVIGGYLMIKANDFDEALELSKGCPIFNFDGSLELREVQA